jgi:hypothetical protein
MGWKDAPLAEDAASTPAWQNAPLADEPTPATAEPLLDRVPRATGLTARVGLEAIPETVGGLAGLVNTAGRMNSGNFTPQGLLVKGVNRVREAMGFGDGGEQVAQATNAIANTGRNAADLIGLPTPETGAERIISMGGKSAAGAGGVIGAANKITSPAYQKIAKFLATAPKQQVIGAAASGAAGQGAKESGVGEGGQFVASLAGGLAGASMVNAGSKAAKAITPTLTSTNADDVAATKLKEAGIDVNRLSESARKEIIGEVQQALKISPQLDEKALGRLADYKATGLTPMNSSLTLNPVEITQERNLAKMGANSRDPAVQKLSTLQRDNDVKLIENLNNLGADAEDAVTASNKIIQTLNVKDEATKKVIGKFYEQARNTQGRSAMLNPREFTQKANDMLDDALLGGKLPGDVRNKLNSIAKGDTPLTVDVAEQLKTNLGSLQRSSTDPAEKLALGKVREALDNTPLIDGQGQEAINAFNKARKANADYMKMVERNPALQAVRNGVEPDKFVQQYILGNGGKANISQVKALRETLKDNPEAISTVRGQMVAFIKNKATGGSADEVANFSPKNYSNALKTIGDDKLAMFFSKEDIDMLKAIGRVASYEKFQPTGAAVNNSNTAPALMSLLQKVADSPIVRRIPIVNLAGDSVKDAVVSAKASKALAPAKALAVKAPKPKSEKAPLASLYGLGAVQESDD